MFNMTAYAEVSRLLEQVAEVADRLSPNERELYHSLTAKYAEPGQTDAEDKICLELLLRNIQIREAHGLETGESAIRAIELPRKPDPRED